MGNLLVEGSAEQEVLFDKKAASIQLAAWSNL